METVALILERCGADAAATVDKAGRSPLLHAVKTPDVALEVCRLLVDAGGDASHANRRGETVMMVAANMGRPDICGLLLDHGASPATCNDEGMSALDCARDDETLGFLVERMSETELADVGKRADRLRRWKEMRRSSRDEKTGEAGEAGAEGDETEDDGKRDTAEASGKEADAEGSSKEGEGDAEADSKVGEGEAQDEAGKARAKEKAKGKGKGKGKEKAAEASAGGSDLDSSADAETLCVVCFVNEKNATIVHGDTGHMACCLECARILQDRGDGCPICRAPIEHVIRQFNV